MNRARIESFLRDFLSDNEVGTGDGPEDDLGRWRLRIDAIDQSILLLLNERSKCANRIGRIKKKLDLPVYVPSREEEVIRLALTSNRGPLPDEAVRHVFERIIDETRSLERRKFQDDEEE